MTPLRQRLLDDMRIRNLARNTQETYLLQVATFAKHFARSPELLGPEEVRAYQVHLLNTRKRQLWKAFHKRLYPRFEIMEGCHQSRAQRTRESMPFPGHFLGKSVSAPVLSAFSPTPEPCIIIGSEGTAGRHPLAGTGRACRTALAVPSTPGPSSPCRPRYSDGWSQDFHVQAIGR